MGFQLHLAKENFKFSCSHFTIMSAKTAERLHGHNYHVEVLVEVKKLSPDLGFAFDFNDLKPEIKKVCDQLDERILIPEKSPYLDINKSKNNIEVTFQKKFYSFPAEDVCMMPMVNVTSEELAHYFYQRLSKLKNLTKKIQSLKVIIEETKGQRAIFDNSL